MINRVFVEFDYETELVHAPEMDTSIERFETIAQFVEDTYARSEKILMACSPSFDVLWQCGSMLVRLAKASHIFKWGGGKEIYVLLPVDAYLS